MKVYSCQLDIVWEDKPANYARATALLQKQAVEPGSLVVLPELFASGFSMNVAGIGEPPGGPTETFLAQLARDLQSFVVGGVSGRETGGKGLNQAVVFGPSGKELTRYVKMQPFSLGGELDHYAAGSQPVSFCWQELVVAPFICYDLRFPELFRASVRTGTQMFVVIANWPVMRIGHWITLLQARAIENQAYVVGVNRAGTDPKLIYNGHSIVVDPHGTILVDAGEKEAVTSCEIAPKLVTEWRRDFPAVRDMR